MEAISVFDIFKIGVGPSSSHTMGPWRAALQFAERQFKKHADDLPNRVEVTLYGSLAKTGRGHGTGRAVMWGLSGLDPVTCDVSLLPEVAASIRSDKKLDLGGRRAIRFDPDVDIEFRITETLPFHPNGMRFRAWGDDQLLDEKTVYSIGGGFITDENGLGDEPSVQLPYPIATSRELESHCAKLETSIAEVVRLNERTWRSDAEITAQIERITDAMIACVHRGCQTDGILPGGLNVKRRAHAMHLKLLGDEPDENRALWLESIKSQSHTFTSVLKWVSCFALAVNEENASFGRVVTAPTNGAAGVIPAVLLYYLCFCDEASPSGTEAFVLTAGEIGSLFKKGATISAALGGCQAEIGVSSAMAAAALTACLGGSVGQALMAAEIAMEHHVGLTCDPIGGLVQIPCIERNSMGAMKAITASKIALESDPEFAKVPLDTIIRSMWETAKDMHERYKETSEGGLAVQIPVNVIEC